MIELLKFIVENLASNPAAIKIEPGQGTSEKGEEVILLTVAPEDMGLIIGKKGRTIRAIRTIVNLKAQLQEKRVFVKLNDINPPPAREIPATEEAPVIEETPAEESPAEESPIIETPAEEAPVEETSDEE